MLTCVVLAAGSSSRLGRPKQLVTFEGETLIHRAARTASEIARTVVVIPPEAAEIRAAVADLDVVVVENREAGEGMASSIRCGVSAADGDVLLMVCDQPRVTAAHLRALASANAPVAATGYRSIAGVPVFFSARFRDELLALGGDAGAKRVIEAHRQEATVVPFEDAAIDIDVPGDLESL